MRPLSRLPVFFVSFVVPISPPIDDPDLEALWQAQAEQLLAPDDKSAGHASPDPALTEQFLVLVTCRDEKEQVELLGRLTEEGRECKALLG
jgi:hypothetical protein